MKKLKKESQREQLNVIISAELKACLQIAAVRNRQRLYMLVEDACTWYLGSQDAALSARRKTVLANLDATSSSAIGAPSPAVSPPVAHLPRSRNHA